MLAMQAPAIAEPLVEGNEVDDDQYFESTLFLDENYVTKTYELHDNISVEVAALETSSTDVDLTGQIVWKVSEIMANYIVSNKERFVGRSVLELGAGAGLSGLVASKYAKRTLLTDGSEVVLRLLEKNAKSNQNSVSNTETETAMLQWGESLEVFDYKYPMGFDLIIGADIVQWTASIPALFQTVSKLLAPHSEARFIVAFVCRSEFSLNVLENTASEYQFTFTSIDVDEFMSGYNQEERSAQDYKLFEFRRISSDK